ncbi:MAG: CotH kinase family protein [Clostridia bacterium]|nr:CotH kinase family protein [Clostridia bacterium]
MKTTTVKMLSLLVALVLLIGCLPAVAIAAEDPVLWASPVTSDPEASRPISAVKWWYDEGDAKYYLFMPSDGNLDSMQVWFDNTTACSIDGTALTYGQVTDLLTAGDHTANLGGTDYPVCVMKSANIASLYITTESGNMDYIHAKKGNKESGMIKFVNAEGKVKYDGVLDEIKGRGNATWSRAKKPYQFKLDKKTDLIGAGKHKTWILLANYLERSLIRNKIAYDLANDAGLTNSCESVYTDLYCNGKYMGTFQLCEKVQIGDNRIEINDLEGAIEDVNELDPEDYPTFGDETADGTTPSTMKGVLLPNNPEDITGGYLLELDYAYRYAEEISGFVTSRGQCVTIKEPECASPEMVAYISNFFQEFEDAVFAIDGKNPTTGKYYYEYFDLTSLARKYIIEELTRNIDADVTSQYYYKPSDKESTVGYCGPVWDYDNSMGNYNGSQHYEGLCAKDRKQYIYNNLYKKEGFLNAVKAEWENNYMPLIREILGETPDSEDTLLTNMEAYLEMLAPSAAMNFTYWENLNSVDGSNYIDTGDTYEEHVTYLKNYIAGRSAYLSSIWSVDDIKAESSSSDTSGGITSIMNYTGSHAAYTVSNEAELQRMADLITAGNNMKGITILQTADITLTKQFTPGGYSNTDNGNPDLSTKTNTFNGTYNGQGYKIYNLQINLPQQNGAGVFASAYGATFIDMHIASGSVYSYNRAAGITGYGDACSFIRCSNGADIEVDPESKDGAGGLAGVARYSAVFESCYNTGSVKGYYVGGMTGWGQGNITITNSYNLGTIILANTKGEARPLSRVATNSGRDFSSCFYLESCGATDICGAYTVNTADVTGGSLAVALNQTSAVWEQGESYPIHKPMENSGLVTLTTRTFAEDTLIHTVDNFYVKDSETSLVLGNEAFIARVLLNGEEYTGGAVTLTENGILDIYLTVNAKPISDYSGKGDYYITDAADLQMLLDLTQNDTLEESTFFVIADIDGSDLTTGGTFGGILNGKFSRISGLTAPLFTEIAAKGDIRKLILCDGNITGDGAVAALNLGKLSYITTQNLVVRGSAGIVGINKGKINACSVDGYVISKTAASGIAGVNEGTIQNCLNNARLVAVEAVTAGISYQSTGTVESCINKGMLYGGQDHAITAGAAANCYNWDWCVGEGADVTNLTDADMAEANFLGNFSTLYWEAGKYNPVPAAKTYELGDANGDHKVSITDAIILLRYLNDLIDEEDFVYEAADVNGNGFMITDVIRIMQYIVGSYDF